MAGKDTIAMSMRELKRLKVIQAVLERQITQKLAAEMVGLSARQIRRLVRAVRQEGESGVVHRSRGRPSNRKISEKIKQKALGLYRKKYHDFGPTLASEKLLEEDGIGVSVETLRQWLMAANLWSRRRKRSSHRQWRKRKACFGEMIQMDGSHHDWLEGRGPQLVLMGYIDDATNRVFVRFYDYEGTLPAMDSFKGYVRHYGLPQSVYLDKHSTYKSTKKLTIEEELAGLSPMSQFERALDELGVEVIHAHSPQAKGRIERLFGVLQDRLIKEMRLQGVKTKEEANAFLKAYLPKYNQRFKVCPANKTDVHVRLPRYFNLDKYLCIKTQRTVRNDRTIAYEGKLYQIRKAVVSKKVTVEERLDGSLHITSGGTSLKYREITERPRNKTQGKGHKTPYTPPRDHPWRQWPGQQSLNKRKDVCLLNK